MAACSPSLPGPARMLHTTHPVHGKDVPVYILTTWFIARDDGRAIALEDPGDNWQGRAGLYPYYSRFVPSASAAATPAGDAVLVGQALPMPIHCRDWAKHRYQWHGQRRQRFLARASIPLQLARLPYEVAYKELEVSGRPYQSVWNRSISQLMVWFPECAFMLHDSHPAYLDHLERFIARQTRRLKEEDGHIVHIPYNFDSREMRYCAPDADPVPLCILGIADIDGAWELEAALGMEMALRGHLDLQNFNWIDWRDTKSSLCIVEFTCSEVPMGCAPTDGPSVLGAIAARKNADGSGRCATHASWGNAPTEAFTPRSEPPTYHHTLWLGWRGTTLHT
ncbi:hypothetical protein CALCODRAFT_541374, partial [Calocera cornea HHB12733]